MKLPDFLIIGAMKAGTTTLYRDLLTNPAVFMPANKEPGNLCRDEVLTERGRREYADLFRFARPGQICGEASTNYTKLPDYPGVPQRARAVCGENLRVIYIVREPVARIISHHYHSYCSGVFGPDINREVRERAELLNYTRYAMQITPWIETFDRENVLILNFEEYVRSRRETIREVSRFLGIEPQVEQIDESAVYNKSEGKPLRTTFWRIVRRNRVYQRYVQPMLPVEFRDRMRSTFLPKAPPRPAGPSESTVQFIHQQLTADRNELHQVLGVEFPFWSGLQDEPAFNDLPASARAYD